MSHSATASQSSLEEKEIYNPPTPNPELDYPEGGLHGWLALTGSCLVYFVTFGIINSFGAFQNFYLESFLSNYSTTVIAFIGALQITLLYVFGVVVGPLFDAIGLKYLYPVGALGGVVSLVALSFTRPQQIWQQFLSQGVLFGLTVGFGTYPALAVVGQYFKAKRALAMGTVAAASSIGGVCLPIMVSRLIKNIGFAWTVRVLALLTLVCYVLAMLISRTRLPKKPLPKARNLVDFGGFRDPRYLTLAIGSILVNLGLYSPYYYIEPCAIEYGVSPSIHTYLLPMLNGLSFFGRIIGGQLADRYGRLNVLCPCTLIAGVLCFALWLPARGAAALIAFSCAYGFFSGVFISVTPPAVGQISPVDRLGARIGTFFLPTAVATLLGTPIGGAFVRDGTSAEYHHVAIFAGVMVLAGGVMLCVSRMLCDRNLKTKW